MKGGGSLGWIIFATVIFFVITDVYTAEQGMKKSTILFLVIIIILASFTGCKKASLQIGKSYESKADSINDNTGTKVIEPSINPKQDIIKIALVIGDADSEYKDTLYRSMLKEANNIDKSVEIVSLGSSSIENYNEQIKIIENCISDGYDGIVLFQVNDEKLTDVLKKAKSRGIFIISLDNGIFEDEIDINLSIDEKKTGEKCAKSVCNLLEEKGKVAIVLTQEEEEKKDGIYQGFKTELEENEHEDISIELVEVSESEKQSAENILENMLKSETKIDVIWSIDEQVSVKIAKELSNNEICDIMLVTCGDTEELKDELKAGCIQSTTQSKYSALGDKAVDYVVELVKGERFEEKNVKINVEMITHSDEE